MGLFNTKPEGTIFGNILRGVASTLTGGILGNGSMLRARNERLGITTTGENTVAQATSNILTGQTANQLLQKNAQNQVDQTTNKYLLYGGGLLVAILLIFTLTKK